MGNWARARYTAHGMQDHIDPPSTSILDASGHIAVDLACANCRYNLRTQPVDGKCPECAFPVARSAHGYYLRSAPPRWVKKLADGATRLIIGVICSLGLAGLAYNDFFIYGFTGAAGVPGGGAALVMLILAASAVCLWLLVGGLWRLTASDPLQRYRNEGLSARRVTRFCAVLLPIFALPGLALPTPWTAPWRVLMSTTALVAWALLIAECLVLPLALLQYLSNLMRRVPSSRLAALATAAYWAGLSCGLTFVAGAVIRLCSPYFPTVWVRFGPTTVATNPPPFGALRILGWFSFLIGGAGVVVILLADFVLLILARRVLAKVGRLAEVSAGQVTIPGQ